MRYYVSFGGTSRDEPLIVDVVERPDGTFEVRMGDRSLPLDVAQLGAQLSVRVAGYVIDLTTHGRPPEIDVSANGHRSRVLVESERTMGSRDARARTAHREQVVKSPMAGRVIKVLVAEGQAVRDGEGVAVIEAMKMENEVRARAAGTVARVHVEAGTAVEKGATLVTLL